jgi:hypothetical protein
MRGKLDMHGVHGRRWYACVGWEDRKMAAHFMMRSGATLIRDGGGAIGEKSEVEEAWAGSWIPGVKEEEEEMRRINRFLGRTSRSGEMLVWSLSFSAAISDLKDLRPLDLGKLNENLGTRNRDSNCEEAEEWVLYETLCVMRTMEFCL